MVAVEEVASSQPRGERRQPIARQAQLPVPVDVTDVLESQPEEIVGEAEPATIQQAAAGGDHPQLAVNINGW